MKNKQPFKSLFSRSLIAVMLLTLSFESMAQEKGSSDFKNFKIRIEKTENGFKMQSLEGSAWIDLNFRTAWNKPRAIDEYGVTKLRKVSTEKDTNLADYLFTITETKDGVKLIGVEGTAWKELIFTLVEDEKQIIDQFGVVD